MGHSEQHTNNNKQWKPVDKIKPNIWVPVQTEIHRLEKQQVTDANKIIAPSLCYTDLNTFIICSFITNNSLFQIVYIFNYSVIQTTCPFCTWFKVCMGTFDPNM